MTSLRYKRCTYREALAPLPTDQPWRNVVRDVDEGWGNVAAACFASFPPEERPRAANFRQSKVWWPLHKLEAFVTAEAFIFPVKSGSLRRASRRQILRWAEQARPSEFYFVDEGDVPFVQRVADILDRGFPALILLDSKRYDLHTMLDGYGRYHLAVALGVDRLPVVRLQDL
jgi:hypothetical protein